MEPAQESSLIAKSRSTGDVSPTNTHDGPQVLLKPHPLPNNNALVSANSSSGDESSATRLVAIEEKDKVATRRSGWPFQKPPEDPLDTTWTATWLRWSPISGLLCLVFVLLSIPASAAVLKAADGQLTEGWTVPPNVWLVVFTGIGNKALGFAAVQGAIITWWLRALSGSTAERLHRDWSHGAGSEMWSILTAGSKTGMLGLTTICATIILADGILLQKTLRIAQEPADEAVQLDLKFTPEIPVNFSGSAYISDYDHITYSDHAPWVPAQIWWLNFSRDYLAVHQSHLRKQPIVSVGENKCRGNCTATVHAPAMFFNTRETFLKEFIDFDLVVATNGTWFPEVCNEEIIGQPPPTNATCPILLVHMTATPNVSWEGITVAFGRLDDGAARTNFTIDLHHARPAVAKYQINVHANGVITLDDAPPEFVAWANNTRSLYSPVYLEMLHTGGAVPTMNTTFATILSTTAIEFYTYILAEFAQEDWFWSVSGMFDEGLLRDPITRYVDTTQPAQPLYNEPYEQVLAGMNDVLFRLSLQAANTMDHEELLSRIDPGLTVPSQVHGTRIDEVPKYRLSWAWFAAAAVLQVICVGLVSATYWGYWQLGRAMNFSPLEIAKAFDAPAFREVPSNMGGLDIAKHLGKMEMKYGAVAVTRDVELEGDEMKRRLIFDESARVYKPMSTFTFVP